MSDIARAAATMRQPVSAPSQTGAWPRHRHARWRRMTETGQVFDATRGRCDDGDSAEPLTLRTRRGPCTGTRSPAHPFRLRQPAPAAEVVDHPARRLLACEAVRVAV